MKSQLQAGTGLYIAAEWTDLLAMAMKHCMRLRCFTNIATKQQMRFATY